MAAIPAFLILLLVLILVHEAGHALAARASGCRVEEFGFGFPPRILGKRVGGTLFSLNALPIGGFVRITGEDNPDDHDPRSFAAKPRWQRALVLSAGVLANLLLAAVAFSLVAGIGLNVPVEGAGDAISGNAGVGIADRRVEILDVHDTPALRAANLRPADVLVAVNGVPVREAAEAAERIRNFTGESLSLTIGRGGVEELLALAFSPPKTQGEKIGIALLDVGTIRVPWTRAPLEGVAMTGRTVVLTGRGLARVAYDALVERKGPADVAGPVGIASITGIVAKRGWSSFLEFTGILSVNLALINALPIPALDGGRLAFLLLDALGLRFLRGRPERLAHTIGFALLLFLLALITVNDLQKLAQ